MFKRLVKGLLIAFLVSALIIYGIISTLPYEKWLKQFSLEVFKGNGIENIDYTIANISRKEMVVTNVKMGLKPDLQVKNIVINYDISDVRYGRVDTVKVNGLEANIYIKDNKISLGYNDRIIEYFEKKKDKKPKIVAENPQISSEVKNLELNDVKINLNGNKDSYFYVKKANVNLKEKNGKLLVEVKNFPLKHFSDLLAMESFSVDGNVSGAVPVDYRNGKYFIAGGSLKSTSGGVVKYKPKGGAIPFAADNENIKFVNTLLENFNFETLEVNVSGDVDDKIISKVSLFGSNPNISGGKKVQLNISLEGNIMSLILNSLKLYQLPEEYIENMHEKNN